ncbi:MAG: hypothetical protein ACYTCU_00650 [Planctomycetota bacterium]|jgi:hypothetical protein
MKTLLIAVLALPVIGLLASEPAASDPVATDPSCSAEAAPSVGSPVPAVERARELMIERLGEQAEHARAKLAELAALDAEQLQELHEAARVWAALRSTFVSVVLPPHALDDQPSDAVSVGGEEIAALVDGQERLLDALSEMLDARWEVLVALQLTGSEACGEATRKFLTIEDTIALLAKVPGEGDAPLFLRKPTADRARTEFTVCAGGDWEALGMLQQVGNALSDLAVDAGRVIQVTREAADARDVAAQALTLRSRWLLDVTARLQELSMASGTGC